MSEKANKAVIGAFVIGAVALIVVAVVVFGSGTFFKDTRKYVLFFEGSVSGLNVGAPVTFRGVSIGSVIDIKIYLDRQDLSLKIPVFVQIDPSRITEIHASGEIKEFEPDQLVDLLVERGLRAQLGIQSLVTSQLYVNLDFYPQKPARFVSIETEVKQLPTVSSPLEELSRTLETLPLDEMANKILSTLEGIEAFVNSPELREMLTSLEAAVKEAKALLGEINLQVQPVSEDIRKTLGSAQKLLQNIDTSVSPLTKSLQAAINNAGGVAQRIDKRVDPLLGAIEETFKATRAALTQVNKTLSEIEGATGSGARLNRQVNQTLQELSAAARSIRILADYLERHPDALLRGKR